MLLIMVASWRLGRTRAKARDYIKAEL